MDVRDDRIPELIAFVSSGDTQCSNSPQETHHCEREMTPKA